MQDPLVNLVAVVGFLIVCISTMPTILFLGARMARGRGEDKR